MIGQRLKRRSQPRREIGVGRVGFAQKCGDRGSQGAGQFLALEACNQRFLKRRGPIRHAK